MTSIIDRERLAAVVGAIPAGRWMSYGDVAAACGATDRHARTLNQRFIRDQIAGAHRVLKAGGTVSAGVLGGPGAVQRRLEAEGLAFDGGAAHRAARLYVRDLPAFVQLRS